jgi:hypothetical protein
MTQRKRARRHANAHTNTQKAHVNMSTHQAKANARTNVNTSTHTHTLARATIYSTPLACSMTAPRAPLIQTCRVLSSPRTEEKNYPTWRKKQQQQLSLCLSVFLPPRFLLAHPRVHVCLPGEITRLALTQTRMPTRARTPDT